MMDSLFPDITAPRINVTSTDTPAAPTSAKPSEGAEKGKKNNRRGNGSKQKRFTGMRNDKNTGYEADRFNNLVNKYDMDDSLKQYCTSMLVGPGTGHPSRKVEIKCDEVIPDLVKETVSFLNTKKLILPDTAAADLVNVVKLQVKTKEILARRGTGLALPSDAITSGVERTRKYLYRAPHGIAFYLSNIGKIDYRGQLIFPKTDVASPPPPDTTGMYKTEMLNSEGQRLYVTLTPQGRLLYPDTTSVLTATQIVTAGVVQASQYVFDVYDNLDGLISRYTNILRVIEQKHSYLISEIDFKECIGTTSQLVGSSLVRGETYSAFSSVPIVDHMLAIGAGLRFGRNSTDPYHNIEYAHAIRDTNPGTFLTEIQDRHKPPPTQRA